MHHASLSTVLLLVPTVAFAQNQPPVADAGADRFAYTGSAISLSGSGSDPDGDAIVAVLWTVEAAPDGADYNLLSAENPGAVFVGNTAGTYRLAFAVYDGGLWSAPDTLTVFVATNQPPVAVAGATPTEGVTPLSVFFDGTASTDPEGRPLSYYWTFGDGSDGSYEASLTHVYAIPGTFAVTLEVTDELGMTDFDVVSVYVTRANQAPTVSVVATPTSGAAPLEVQFSATVTDGDNDPLTYAWDFGDSASTDNTSTVKDASHLYQAAGTYYAWLTVSDGRATASASAVISVAESNPVTMTVASAVIQFTNKKKTTGAVTVRGEFEAPLPAADDTVALFVDGILVAAADFGAFRHLWRDQYVFMNRGHMIRLNFEHGRFAFDANKLNLTSLNSADGATIELLIGDTTAVETVPLTSHGCNNNRLVYRRAHHDDNDSDNDGPDVF